MLLLRTMGFCVVFVVVVFAVFSITVPMDTVASFIIIYMKFFDLLSTSLVHYKLLYVVIIFSANKEGHHGFTSVLDDLLHWNFLVWCH